MKSLWKPVLFVSALFLAVILATCAAQARQITAALRSAAQNLEAGDVGARPDVAHHARDYAALLRQHILKEDTILFPAADRVIPTQLHAAVMDDFENVEHEETGEGVHKKFWRWPNRWKWKPVWGKMIA